MHPVFTTIYLVGKDQVLTVDSGEDMDRYRWMLKGYLAATEKAAIALSAVTHHHRDHSANLKWLRAEFQTEIYVLDSSKDLLQEQLPEAGVHSLIDGQTIDVGGAAVRVIETPGHSVDSVCYYLEDEGVLLTGDTILGSTPTTINDLGDYLASLERIRRLPRLEVICPGHGPLIQNPREYVDDYVRHRQEREEQILAVLAGSGEMTSWQITERIYTDINPRLRRAADGNVRTHLRKLELEGRIKVYPGRARAISAAEAQKRTEEEQEHAAVIRKADEIREQARRRALFAQENPLLDEWESAPRFELQR